MTTVADLSEPALIARIHDRLPPAPPWLTVGIGDDAAVAEPERNQVQILTVDALVDGVHFDRRFVPPDAIGYRALAVNLSDIAAMGAVPRLALLSFALPASLPLDDFDAIVAGLTDLAARHRVAIAGGNLTRTPGPLTLDVTVIGSAKRRQVLTRRGARAGDDVYVSGSIGSAGAGLGILRERLMAAKDAAGPAAESLGLGPDDLRLATAYLRPEARVRLGMLLGRNRAATACIDLSDGLADGVHRLAEAGGIGIELDAAAIPIEPAARAWFGEHSEDPVAAAIESGDDYELLFTARPRTRGRLTAVVRHGGVAVTRIGICTREPGVRLRYESKTIEAPRGYDHFRPAGRPAEASRHDAGEPR